MRKILYKIFYLSILTVLISCPGRAEAYRVSGVVAFTYNADEHRSGNVRSSSHSFSQQYSANLQSFFWDPRFLRYNAGVTYNITSVSSSSSSENIGLNYDLNMRFFPGMMVSWDLYDRQSTSKISSDNNIAGYDLNTNSYGGSLQLNLSRRDGGRRGNNNNVNNNNSNNNNNSYNYNNNNNKSGSLINFRLPDIGLSYGHVESDSAGALNPINESRDNVGLTLAYRINARADLNMGQTDETYKNFITGGNYETKSTTVASKILVSPEADLNLSGSLTDRTTSGFAGFGRNDTAWYSTAALNFKERDGIRHSYTYSYNKSQSDFAEMTGHNAAANVSYQLNRDLSLRGGLHYTLAEYIITSPTATVPQEKQSMESGGAQTGVAYRKLYTPEFLGLFAMNTDYNFNTGFVDISSTQIDKAAGSGWYYENAAALGLTSIGWKKDSVATSYNVSSRRDHSPLTNNVRSQGLRLDASTVRIPQTTFRANASYTVTESSASNYSVFLNNAQNNSSIGNRALFYGVSAVYTATPSLTFDAGASQGRSSNSTPSLSTLQPNVQAPIEQAMYFGAHYGKALTRNVMFRANARDEYRKSFRAKTETRDIDAGLDYRIRQVLMNFTYRWNERLPEAGLNTYQQSYMVKLSRPF